MHKNSTPHLAPGVSALGGAACGLSYEGALRDAMAREERDRRREAGRRRTPPAPQQQRSQVPPREQGRQAGG
ncbi:hypothetical protein JYK14_26325 [Siccirubricoccus sp. KC 17139]|uniref:Uncharacterized protein n=1 Tax=Siccirubricoccus soli TaxID=2899147 RepID=A0ABT1DDI0_9PROT|nr:hypothetical protein [Siccirubricoccus soli]MCO6419657.1 hypothetical protein [Siccirubricoccus soli]MCP2685792.1 hypothetical protein [Siccirubricoccus soli]